MPNCPGANSGSLCPGSDSSASVQVSAVSRRRLTTRWVRGVIALRGAMTGSADGGAIDVQELKPCRVQTLDDHGREAAHQLVAQPGLMRAAPAQRGAVEADRVGNAARARVEVGQIRLEQPRPADWVAVVQRLDRDRPRGRFGLQGYKPLADQEERVRRLAFDNQLGAVGELSLLPQRGDTTQLLRGQVPEHPRRRQRLLDARHACLPMSLRPAGLSLSGWRE